ncbi:MAG: polysaccharide biosynthesis protein [Cyanothece sp. SIO1E1]|nr:polysaccharide biosynthesis protein [Cyanothece sp. SIO1E1]
MNRFINLENFIKAEVTGRSSSLLAPDLERYQEQLQDRLAGKSVLVIGGAGTIGSSFVKAILKFKVMRLFVIDTNENGLAELIRDIRSGTNLQIPETLMTYPINFGSKVFERIWKQEGPFEIVANFAAHKHVRSEKDHYSIEAMVENNVLLAKKLLDLLQDCPPERFFCVSTDKAANPVNVMGASKKLMEEVILAYSKQMHITTARFANVAFSNGSLPFAYTQRLMKQQPLSSPSDVKRYFVSPEESGQLCMLACLLGESGDIFFPKLDPVKDVMTFSAIAERLLNAMGYQPDYCQTEEEARQKAKELNAHSTSYPVYFFKTDTSGEKPLEEFFTPSEAIDHESFTALGVIKNAKRRSLKELNQIIFDLALVFSQGEVSKEKIVAVLKDFLPTFAHIETGKNLDQRM